VFSSPGIWINGKSFLLKDCEVVADKPRHRRTKRGLAPRPKVCKKRESNEHFKELPSLDCLFLVRRRARVAAMHISIHCSKYPIDVSLAESLACLVNFHLSHHDR